MKYDAFNYIISAILSQLCSDNQWHSIVFWSRKLNKIKIWYETHDKKLLIIIIVFKYWCHYFKKSTHSIKVQTDYLNLWFFMIIKKLIRCQAWWAETLMIYDFVIEHCSERLNSANTLSRHSDYEVNKTVDYQTLLMLQIKL